MSDAPRPSSYSPCFGCFHLTYRGPIGILPEEEIREGDDGHYHCRLFSEALCRADEIPKPILSACKETR